MSDIKVGDLVRVAVAPHAHAADVFGWIFQVARIGDCCQCSACGHIFVEPSAWYTDHNAMPLSWLRRIPPLSELESTETKEETHA